jgi:uncharacterized membrane protein YtjA (UPF0391 family)
MLRWAMAFLIIALIAAAFGFAGVASVGVQAAQILCFVFLVLAVLAFVGGSLRAPPV